MRAAALCLSPAFDATAREGEPPDAAGGVPGGKGLNVARWLALRGADVALAGLLGRDDAAPFEAAMREAGIRDAMTRVPGPVRRNVCFVAADGRETKRNAPAYPGLDPAAASADALLRALLGPAGAPPPRFAVLTGSLPAALPPSLYADLAARLREAECGVALDAAGDALRLGLAARPDLAKPNRAEAAAWLGRDPATDADAARAVRALAGTVRGAVALSDGARGCWFAVPDPDGPRAWFVPAPRVALVDPTGAGDALLAELCFGFFAEGRLGEAAMRRAVAAGAAACERPGALPPDPARVDALAAALDVRRA